MTVSTSTVKTEIVNGLTKCLRFTKKPFSNVQLLWLKCTNAIAKFWQMSLLNKTHFRFVYKSILQHFINNCKQLFLLWEHLQGWAQSPHSLPLIPFSIKAAMSFPKHWDSPMFTG